MIFELYFLKYLSFLLYSSTSFKTTCLRNTKNVVLTRHHIIEYGFKRIFTPFQKFSFILKGSHTFVKALTSFYAVFHHM